jgi:hypothetical protein
MRTGYEIGYGDRMLLYCPQTAELDLQLRTCAWGEPELMEVNELTLAHRECDPLDFKPGTALEIYDCTKARRYKLEIIDVSPIQSKGGQHVEVCRGKIQEFKIESQLK